MAIYSLRIGHYELILTNMDQEDKYEPVEPLIIKEMPDQATLEEFLRGMTGQRTVYFDTRTGRFERPSRGGEKIE